MDCLFCKIVNGEVESKKLYEDDLVIAILDLYPNGEGHTLVIPKKHYTDYKEIDDELFVHIKNVGQMLADKLESKLNKNSTTFLFNYLDAQAIKHFHYHVIPGFNQKINKTQEMVYKLMTED